MKTKLVRVKGCTKDPNTHAFLNRAYLSDELLSEEAEYEARLNVMSKKIQKANQTLNKKDHFPRRIRRTLKEVNLIHFCLL